MIYLLPSKDYEKIVFLGSEYDPNFANKYISENNKIYVYEMDSRIVGFLIIEETIDEGSIILLFVSPQYRNKKIGSSLMKYYLDNNDKQRVILEVKDNNIGAITLYKNCGFETISVRKKYYQDKTDALVMEKRNTNE